MRVVQVIAPARYGGAESVALHLAAALRDAGTDSAIAAIIPGSDGHPFTDAVLKRGLELCVVNTPARHYAQQVGALADYVRATGADVLHAHNPHANVVARCAALRTGRRCVATFHGHLGRTPRERAYDWIDLWTLRTMDAVITVSHSGAHEIVRRAPQLRRRVHTLPSAVRSPQRRSRADARVALGAPMHLPVIGWVGRFSQEKDPELFIRSLARAADHPWHAVMVGDGPMWTATRQLARDLGLAERISFAGWHSDASTLVTAFDLISITSQREQLPTVMLEALAVAVPVISVPVGDIPAIARATAGIELVPGEPGRIAEAIIRLLADTRDRTTRGQAGADYVHDRHAPEDWAAKHLALYATNALTTSRMSV